MKKLFQFSLLLMIGLSISTFTSCKKDPCENTLCFNGGTCNDGNCFCINGYSGSSCQNPPASNLCEGVVCYNGGYCIDGDCVCINGYSGSSCEIAPEETDPCENVTCLNDGYCANGECVCADGYTGADCSQQETPSTIKITKIVVTGFPATDDGAGWDLTSAADIYPRLMIGTSNEIWESPTFFQNANPNQSYEFTPSPPISLQLNQQYILHLYDYDDFDADDFMGLTVFTSYSSTNDFPDVLYPSYQEVSFEVHLDYTW